MLFVSILFLPFCFAFLHSQSMRKQRRDVSTWLNFVDCTEIKAFVELTVTSTIRAGAQNLLMVLQLSFLQR